LHCASKDLFQELLSQQLLQIGSLRIQKAILKVLKAEVTASKVLSDAFEKITAPQIGPELFPKITNGDKSFNI